MPPEEEDDEELECRVCRDGLSQGPLLRPCKCAGSIMYAHQDCLLQWLRHSGKDACELCKHRFAFRPVYAPDAPPRVPTAEVTWRCLRKAVCEYLPFLARLLLAAGLWLGVVPCTTSWVFRIWIRRASFLVPDLVRRRILQGGGGRLWNDVVSGIIIAAFIIFSFLSLVRKRKHLRLLSVRVMRACPRTKQSAPPTASFSPHLDDKSTCLIREQQMSFADFLRFHWDAREENLGQGEEAVPAAAPVPPVAGGAAGRGGRGGRAIAPAGAPASRPRAHAAVGAATPTAAAAGGGGGGR